MITKWEKVGGATLLAGKYGKKLISQLFRNPHTGAEEEYVMFGQKDWSVVLAITKDNQVLTVTQYKQGCDKVIVELPAGTADFTGTNPAEDPEDVMRKELRDETGYEAGNVISLGAHWIASRNSWTRYHCFLATGCKEVGLPKEHPNEPIQRGFVPLKEWVRMALLDGEIDEPSAVVATARALGHLGIKLTFPE